MKLRKSSSVDKETVSRKHSITTCQTHSDTVLRNCFWKSSSTDGNDQSELSFPPTKYEIVEPLHPNDPLPALSLTADQTLVILIIVH